jgi:hypothetical protein
MLFCGADVAASSATLVHHHDGGQAGPHQHDGDPGAAVARDVAHGSETPHAQLVAPAADETGSLHGLTHGKCSVCSSCCSAAALPSAAIAASAASPHAPAFPALEHANPDHRPARIERPPRLHLA